MRSPKIRSLWLVAGAVAFAAVAVVSVRWWTKPFAWDDDAEPPPPLRDAIARYAAGLRPEAEDLARACLRRYDAPAWEGRLRVLVAARMADAGDAARILEFLPRPLPLETPLAPYGDLLRARGLLARGDYAGAIAASARAGGANGFPQREEAVRAEAEALAASGRKAAAVSRLDREESPALRLAAARAARAAGDRAGTRRRLAAIVLDAPAGGEAERALEELRELVPDPAARFTAAERSRLAGAARRLEEAGRLDAGLDLLRSARRPGSSAAAVAPAEAVVEAAILLRLGRTAEAEPLVARALRAGGVPADEASYLSARLALARGRTASWRGHLSRLASRPSVSRWRLAALADLARAEEGKPSPAALAAYRRYRDAAGRLAEPGVLWREAWVAYDLGRMREADEGIARVLARTDAPRAIRAAALYWSGKRLEAGGRTADAIARFRETAALLPGHYYGMLASRRLGLPDPDVEDGSLPPAPDPRSPVARRWLRAARELRSVGLREAASSAYGAAARLAGREGSGIAIEGADAALAAGFAADALTLLEAASVDRDTADPAALGLRHLRLLAPLPQEAAIRDMARLAGLDRTLVAAIALQESGLNPIAVSSAGARGLLQVLPSTGAEVARRIGVAGFRPEKLFDPEINLRLGCAYFREILDRVGSVPVALAAYNAGPSRAVRWMTPGDDRAGERYVERIPILETRGYVKRILANQRLYRIAWGHER